MQKEIKIPEVSEIPLLEALFECGAVKLSVHDTVILLSDKIDSKTLETNLLTEGTPEYLAYHKGMSEGKFTSLTTLKQKGDVDSFFALSSAQKYAIVADSIRDKFGIDS
jgi:hypothetical protein